jgi:hypothetical protein
VVDKFSTLKLHWRDVVMNPDRIVVEQNGQTLMAGFVGEEKGRQIKTLAGLSLVQRRLGRPVQDPGDHKN